MLKGLYLDGFNLENFIEIASKAETEKFFKTEGNIKFTGESLEKIKNVKDDIYILASVETWCPYARAFVATIKKIKEVNPKINLKFVTMGRGLFEIAEILEIEEDEFVVPTAIILDKDFNLVKSFIGFPKKYSETGLIGKIKNDYFNGLKADEILTEIL